MSKNIDNNQTNMNTLSESSNSNHSTNTSVVYLTDGIVSILYDFVGLNNGVAAMREVNNQYEKIYKIFMKKKCLDLMFEQNINSEQFFEQLNKRTNVEKIIINQNVFIDGDIIKTLKKLLSIPHIRRNLKWLHLALIHGGGVFFRKHEKYYHDIQLEHYDEDVHLLLFENEDEAIFQFQNLQVINIQGIINNNIIQMILKCAPRLRVFDPQRILLSQNYVERSSIVQLIQTCKNMQFINLEYGGIHNTDIEGLNFSKLIGLRIYDNFNFESHSTLYKNVLMQCNVDTLKLLEIDDVGYHVADLQKRFAIVDYLKKKFNKTKIICC